MLRFPSSHTIIRNSLYTHGDRLFSRGNKFLNALDKTLTTEEGTLDAVPALIDPTELFTLKDNESKDTGGVAYIGTGPKYDHFIATRSGKRYKVKKGEIRVNKRTFITSNGWQWGNLVKINSSEKEAAYEVIRDENAENAIRDRLFSP